MFFESERFDLRNTSMRLIGGVRPPENKFYILSELKLFDLHNTLIRASPWKQIEAFIGSRRFDLMCLTSKERHSNDKIKRCLSLY